MSTENSKTAKNFSNFIEKLSSFPKTTSHLSKNFTNSTKHASTLLKSPLNILSFLKKTSKLLLESEETCKKLVEHNDSTVNNSYISNNTTYIEELFPKALCEIESSINQLKKCYFSFYKKKKKSEQNTNSLTSEMFSEAQNPIKMDIDTLKKLYFNNFNRETNDINELYSFYKEFIIDSKAKTFRNPNHHKGSSANFYKTSNSAMKKNKEFQEICRNSKENFSQELRKICKSNPNEKSQKNKLSLSVLNKNLFNQKLNFINLKSNASKPPKPELFFNTKFRNSKSVEKMNNKREILNNISIGMENIANISCEKGRNSKKIDSRIEKIVSPNNQKSNIFANLPKEQQKILMTHTKVIDIEKIRNISKIFKNYRCFKSEIPEKIIQKKENFKGNENKFMNFIENFFEKSVLEQKNVKVEKLLGRNEEIDEKSFFEGVRHVTDYNNFQGKDISNEPSFDM